MSDFIPLIIHILQEYGYIIVFLGAFFAGETFILAAAFLASLGFFDIFLVLGVCFLGIMLSDSFWYFIGWRGRHFISRYRHFICPKRFDEKIDSFKEKFTDHYSNFLIVGKFVYGLRILSLVTCGHQRIPYSKFLYYNFLGNCLWLSLVIGLGYWMGFSWNYLDQFNSYARYLVILGVVLLFVVRWLFKKIITYSDKSYGLKRN